LAHFLARHIDWLIPSCAGALVLLAPQIFTKADLTLEANASTRKRLRLAGILGIVAGILLFIATLAK